MQHILFVTPYVPSPVRIRPFGFIRELARQGHRVTLVCLVQPAWEECYLTEVAPFCERIYPIYLHGLDPYISTLKSLPTKIPLSVAYCQSNQFTQFVRDLVDKNSFDLIHTEFVRATPATIDIGGIPKLYDAVDSLTLAYRRSILAAHVPAVQRLRALAEWIKMRHYEPWVIGHYDKTIISSSADGTELNKVEIPCEVIPNGVDFDYFSFQNGDRSKKTIVFLGKMSYYVNVASVLWFYREVFPHIRKRHPDVRLLIVGRNPIPAITRLSKDAAVSVTGTVPDVRPYLREATLAICPMVSGSGIQNKLLEAMSLGTPCVATSIACMALQTQPNHDILVANSAQNFASATCAVIEQSELRRNLAENGRLYVERFHNWQSIGKSLDQIYAQLANYGYPDFSEECDQGRDTTT